MEDMYYQRMDGTPADIAAFILAGGKSTRMGADKALITLDGRTLLARALEVTRSVTNNVRIVGDRAKYGVFATVVEDVFRECGPLGGIHAALRASQAELNLILAVDVPFASQTLLQYLISRAKALPSAQVTLVRTSEGWQPLCAVYRRGFADAAESALRARRYKIDALFDPATTRVISADELQSAGLSPRMFRNLNTPEELSEASGQ